MKRADTAIAPTFENVELVSAVHLERAGVSRSVAMKLIGHKTEAIYRRHAIVNEADLIDGVGKLAESTTGTIRGTKRRGGKVKRFRPRT